MNTKPAFSFTHDNYRGHIILSKNSGLIVLLLENEGTECSITGGYAPLRKMTKTEILDAITESVNEGWLDELLCVARNSAKYGPNVRPRSFF